MSCSIVLSAASTERNIQLNPEVRCVDRVGPQGMDVGVMGLGVWMCGVR